MNNQVDPIWQSRFIADKPREKIIARLSVEIEGVFYTPLHFVVCRQKHKFMRLVRMIFIAHV